MHLSPREQERSNKQREVILKNFHKGLRLCNDCGGTGLDNVHYNSLGDATWDGHSFCDKCKGIGYLEWKETIALKLCPHCKGGGKIDYKKCQYCKGEGVLDWIQYMRIGGKIGSLKKT